MRQVQTYARAPRRRQRDRARRPHGSLPSARLAVHESSGL